MNMIEKVARAIHESQREEGEDCLSWENLKGCTVCLIHAKAAIEAMREPTDGMVDEGAQRLASWGENSVWPDDWDKRQVRRMRNESRRVICGVIDSALEEETV